MADKITDFLNDISLQNSSRGTWGIGTVIARAGAKAAQAIMRITVKSAEDQFLISANRDVVLPIIGKTLAKMSYGLKDPALFDVPTATFCVYLAQQVLGRMYAAFLVFITLRPVSEKSTHVLIKGHAIEPFRNKIAAGWVKKVHDEISANLPSQVLTRVR